MPQVLTRGSSRFQLAELPKDMWELGEEAGFVLGKTERQLAKLEEFLAGTAIDTMLELGIWRGGSVAYFAELLKPRRLVAIEIGIPAAKLERWIDERGARGRIRTYYGTDQADGDRLRRICREAILPDPLDLIVDDASHELERTRASFNTLFRYLRPGGIYMIEDWAWGERFGGLEDQLDPRLKGTPPLSILVNELIVASAKGDDLIADVFVTQAFAAVRRGARAVDDGFDIRDYI